MADLDLAAITARSDAWAGLWGSKANQAKVLRASAASAEDVPKLLAELARLAAELAEARAVIAGQGDDEQCHIIDLRQGGWTLQHPLSCRPNLFDCPVNHAAEALTRRPVRLPGLYRCDARDGRLVIAQKPKGSTTADNSGEHP